MRRPVCARNLAKAFLVRCIRSDFALRRTTSPTVFNPVVQSILLCFWSRWTRRNAKPARSVNSSETRQKNRSINAFCRGQSGSVACSGGGSNLPVESHPTSSRFVKRSLSRSIGTCSRRPDRNCLLRAPMTVPKMCRCVVRPAGSDARLQAKNAAL